MTQDGFEQGDSAFAARVTGELERVLSGPVFSRSPQLQAMLKYLVTEALAGRSDQIKAFNIAVDVFGRNASFDSTNDSIVRVQAGRLRDALTNHYRIAGNASDLVIDLPKGAYVPVFTAAEHLPPGNTTCDTGFADRETAAVGGFEAAATTARQVGSSPDPLERQSFSRRLKSWLDRIRTGTPTKHLLGLPTPAVLTVLAAILASAVFWISTSRTPDRRPAELPQAAPTPRPQVTSLLIAAFKNLNETPEAELFAKSLTAEVATSLTRTGLVDLRLMPASIGIPDYDTRRDAQSKGAQWVVTGMLYSEGTRTRANVYLMDVEEGAIIWSQEYTAEEGERRVEATADAMMLELRQQLYTALKARLLGKTKLTSAELLLLASWYPGIEVNSLKWQQERVDLARRAIAVNYESGQVYSVLAYKLSLLANLIPAADTQQAWREALAAAGTARLLAPQRPEATYNVALYHFHAGEHDDAQKMMKRTLELAPSHTLARIWNTALPYTCARAPTEVIAELENFDRRLARDNPARWQTKAWLARLYLNNGQHSAATEAAKESINIVPNIGAAISLMVSLVQEGQAQAAQRALDEEKTRWPGFTFQHYASVVERRQCRDSTIRGAVAALYRQASDVLK